MMDDENAKMIKNRKHKYPYKRTMVGSSLGVRKNEEVHFCSLHSLSLNSNVSFNAPIICTNKELQIIADSSEVYNVPLLSED